MHSFIRVLTLTAFVISPIESHAASLSPEEAANHVGETATVCGPVVSATYLPQAPQSPTFLDLGKPFPNQIFSVIILGSDRPKFGAPETSMRDKTVCVTGEIFLYERKPKIILHDPKQLSGG
jgi:micrococcal nuclease